MFNLIYAIPIVSVDISNNNFPELDIKEYFSKYNNLKVLKIGNSDPEKFNQTIRNRFKGLLNFFKEFEKLQTLDIRNIEIR